MLVSRAGDVFAGKSAVACDAIKVDEAWQLSHLVARDMSALLVWGGGTFAAIYRRPELLCRGIRLRDLQLQITSFSIGPCRQRPTDKIRAYHRLAGLANTAWFPDQLRHRACGGISCTELPCALSILRRNGIVSIGNDPICLRRAMTKMILGFANLANLWGLHSSAQFIYCHALILSI
jgi:hypothetical protein